jgi:hypothetical protein
MMRCPLYEIVVREIVTDLDADGTTPAMLDVRRFAAYALTPEDAVTAWADQLASWGEG